MASTRQEERKKKREQTLAALDKLSLNPGPVTKILQSDGSDPDQLIKALAQCPVLSGRVIGVANSAGSSAIHRMESIERCVRHLGAKQTRTIALTMAMQMITQDLDNDPEQAQALWAAATTKAVTAKVVAQATTPEQAEKAYMLGLLQDIALPVLLTVDPAFFNNRLANNDGRSAWTDLEREHFGIDHAELGALMLERWGAPSSLTDAITRHHALIGDDDMAWIAEMPTRFAGLLPHLQEQTTKTQAQTLAAAHGRFLTERYRSIDSLLSEVKNRVKAMGKAAGGTHKFDPEFSNQIIQAVAADTIGLAVQVARLDRQLGDHVQALVECQQDAFSDPLTGLLNRRGFDTFADQMIAQACKANLPVACLAIDLDDFKPINDTFGHAAGDTILQTAAELLKTNVASGDLVARMGGDEFVILVIGDTAGDTHALAQRLHAVCNGRRVPVSQGERATLAMSIGAVFFDRVTKETSPHDVINAADEVMYGIKRAGKAGLKFQSMNNRAA